MDYKKLINDHLDNQTDKTPVVVALLAGLAIGAALGVLFAPGSGSETRNLLSDKTKDLADSAKDKLHSYKEKIKTGADQLADTAKNKYQTYGEKIQHGADSLTDLKDRAVETVRSKFTETKDDTHTINRDIETA